MSRRLVRRFLFVSGLSVVFGVAFGAVLGGTLSVDTVIGSAGTALIVGTPILAFEIFYAAAPAGAALRRLPFASFVLMRLFAWTLWIATATWISAVTVWGGPIPRGGVLANPDFWWSVSYSFVFGAVLVVVLGVSRLLGPGILWRFVTGRYHQPQDETRAVLFIDVVGSTEMAERLGARRFLELLDRFAADVSAVLDDTDGEIHAHIGDEVIATWRLEGGTDLTPAALLPFRLAQRVERERHAYEAAFGVVPSARAALHAGPVVVGEMGDRKREIVILGDTVNTAARIEAVAKQLDRPVLVSAAAMARVALPAGWTAEDLGPVALRGKREAVRLFAIEPG